MCIYCFCGDHPFKWDPPWKPNEGPWHPQIPQPVLPAMPTPSWPIERLKEYLELLKEIKALEDRLGCDCIPNKADYIALFKKRIADLKKKEKPNRRSK